MAYLAGRQTTLSYFSCKSTSSSQWKWFRSCCFYTWLVYKTYSFNTQTVLQRYIIDNYRSFYP